MPSQSYWSDLTNNRISRRRALQATGAGVAGAAFLAACGGSDSSNGGGSGKAAENKRSSIVAEPKDTAKEGKAGGVWKHFARGDATHFDSLVSDTSQVVSISGYLGYAKLLKWKVGRYPAIFDGGSEGEGAETWELSPDKLTLTFKLRKDMKFDRRPPTNNRVMDAEDVVWSWKKYIKNNPGARSLAYDDTNKAAAVSSISAPDKNTVVFKMDHPDASIIPLFSAADKFYIFPKEAESGFDRARTSVARGRGSSRSTCPPRASSGLATRTTT
jgi:ABC-type transport system substrate-binding protein